MVSKRSDFVNQTILVIDDEADIAHMMDALLTYCGARVFVASNGIEALTLLETISPSFILLDLAMPHMDGWETIKAIRSNDRTANQRVIAITAHAMPSDKDNILSAGFDAYIPKPFNVTTVLNELKQLQKYHDGSPTTQPTH